MNGPSDALVTPKRPTLLLRLSLDEGYVIMIRQVSVLFVSQCSVSYCFAVNRACELGKGSEGPFCLMSETDCAFDRSLERRGATLYCILLRLETTPTSGLAKQLLKRFANDLF